MDNYKPKPSEKPKPDDVHARGIIRRWRSDAMFSRTTAILWHEKIGGFPDTRTAAKDLDKIAAKVLRGHWRRLWFDERDQAREVSYSSAVVSI